MTMDIMHLDHKVALSRLAEDDIRVIANKNVDDRFVVRVNTYTRLGKVAAHLFVIPFSSAGSLNSNRNLTHPKLNSSVEFLPEDWPRARTVTTLYFNTNNIKLVDRILIDWVNGKTTIQEMEKMND